MLEELDDVVGAGDEGGDEAVLVGETDELPQVHVLLVVVSPIKLVLCCIEFVHVPQGCLI